MAVCRKNIIFAHIKQKKEMQGSNSRMEVNIFLDNFREAFGDSVQLPLIFGYGDKPIGETGRIGGCFFKVLQAACEGEPISLNGEVITCGGGKLYTGFGTMPERVPMFVSQTERYKQSPADVVEYVNSLAFQQHTDKYLNFLRIDKANSFENMEGLLFFATPDMLSGLTTWAFYDNNAEDAVSAIFGSGCSAVVSMAVRENRINGNRTFLGLFDPSVRPYVKPDELSFVIPASRFQTMYHTMRQSCLFGTKAWAKVKERITNRNT